MAYVNFPDDVPPEIRERFEQVLLRQKWMTLDSMPDVWWTSFTEIPHEQIVQTAQSDIEAAARQAGLEAYEVAVHTGRGRPVVFGS